MIPHLSLGKTAFSRSRQLRLLINTAEVKLAGNSREKIYGMLGCASGKRMKVENRVFFKTKLEAIQAGYRPCAHCLPERYRSWQANHSKKPHDDIARKTQ